MALRLAQLEPQRISAVMALSTALHYDGWGNPWFTPLLPLARVFAFSQSWRIAEKSPFGVKDVRMRAWLEKQMQRLGQSAAGAASLRIKDLLQARQLGSMVLRDLPQLTMPILLLHAKEDECASPKSAVEVASRVRSSTIRFVLLDNCYHMISIDLEKERGLQEMKDFLQSLAAPLQTHSVSDFASAFDSSFDAPPQTAAAP